MGKYINPSDRSKEQFLTENGRRIDLPEHAVEGELPVCLVNNGPFTAAGIAFNDQEIKAFSDPDDSRPKQWWAVKASLLAPFMGR